MIVDFRRSLKCLILAVAAGIFSKFGRGAVGVLLKNGIK